MTFLAFPGEPVNVSVLIHPRSHRVATGYAGKVVWCSSTPLTSRVLGIANGFVHILIGYTWPTVTPPFVFVSCSPAIVHNLARVTVTRNVVISSLINCLGPISMHGCKLSRQTKICCHPVSCNTCCGTYACPVLKTRSCADPLLIF